MTPPRTAIGTTARMRRRLGAMVEEAVFFGLARAGRLHPSARPSRHGVEVLRDVPYADGGAVEHLMDIYRPLAPQRPNRRLLTSVLYVHGGGFRILSKDTHWLMGLAFARRGLCVFNINYRLAPQHRYPSAIADVCQALSWIHRHAREYGADPSSIVLAGESAGANLVTSLALATCYERPEPWARQVWATGIVPRAVLAACGLYQVSDMARFGRRRQLPTWLVDRLAEVADHYLPLDGDPGDVEALDFANPVVLLERRLPPQRPLPPFFTPVGTKDPLLDDTRRLAAALRQLGACCEERYYEGEVHAFHALLWRQQARRCWSDTYEFLDQHLPGTLLPHRPW